MMGREVRRVPKDWEHPIIEYGCMNKSIFKNYDPTKNYGYPHSFEPLMAGYKESKDEFEKIYKEKGLQEAIEWCGAPDINDYMPEWKEEEKTHYQMYENTTEGSPISPVMETKEGLARWLADNNASSFGSDTATYEQWLVMIESQWCFSMGIVDGEIKSGVELCKEKQND